MKIIILIITKKKIIINKKQIIFYYLTFQLIKKWKNKNLNKLLWKKPQSNNKNKNIIKILCNNIY